MSEEINETGLATTEGSAEVRRLRERVAVLENSIADAGCVLDAAIGELVPAAAASGTDEWRDVAREAKRLLGQAWAETEVTT